MPDPLSDAYLQQCEWDARKFQGCWDTGTSGVLAAHVMRLLRELSRVKGEAAVMRAATRWRPVPAAHHTGQARDPSCGGRGTSGA